jgi:hypothetical protein
MQLNYDACQTLLAEGHEHSTADHGRGLGGDTIGEDHIERHGQSYVAELGH